MLIKNGPKGHKCEGQSIELRDYHRSLSTIFYVQSQSLQEVALVLVKQLSIACLIPSLCESIGRTVVIVQQVTSNTNRRRL